MMLFSRLLRLDTDLNPVYKDLAADFSVSEDYLTYEFTLRDDVKWHDGQDFSADDIVYTIKAAIRYPETNAVIRGALLAIKGAADYQSKATEELEGLKVDGNKVTLELSSPIAPCIIVPAEGEENFLFMVLPVRLKADF